jgi:putative transposase
MPTGLKRIYGRGHLHFLTFSCYKRLPLLGTMRARNLFVKVLGQIRERYGFLLVGYVVMPEHVHLLIGEPKEGTPSTVLQMLKQRVSRKMRKNKRGVSKAAATIFTRWR